jgi:DNA segregation ATPase FtsK/SpoIIIE, S-DNA-T family
MAFKHQNSDPQRLLPPSLEDRLLRTLAKGLGAALCLLSAAGWISLLSWSITDPSLTHVTGGVARNWLGSPGAVMADLLLQSLGLASAFALLAPTMWGIELWLAERLPGARLKLMLFPLAVLLLAGGCSALPVLASWPLRQGFGGWIGDLFFALLSGALGAVNPIRGGAVAGILYLAAGAAALAHSVGLSRHDLALLLQATPPLAFPDRRRNPRWFPWWGRWRQRRAAHDAEPPSLGTDAATGGSDTPENDYRRTWNDPTAAANAVPFPLPQAGHGSVHGEAQPGPIQSPLHPAAPVSQAVVPLPDAVGRSAPQWQPGIGARAVLPQMVPVGVSPTPQSAAPAPSPTVAAAHGPRAPVPVPPTAPARAASRIAMTIDFASQHSAPFPVSGVRSGDAADAAYPAVERRARPRDPVFEKSTESGSRSIAERFAPSASVRSAASPAQAPPPRKPGLLNSFRRHSAAHQRPSLNLLARSAAGKASPEAVTAQLRAAAGRLEHGLADFGIDARVIDMRAGPVVTEFIIDAAIGTKRARIMALADEIARAIGVPSVRIASQNLSPDRGAAPDGGHAPIGIEVPNARPETVLLRDILDSDAYRTTDATLPLAIGKTTTGAPVLIDLARLPHLLMAGTAKAGKSVGLNAMILSLLFRHAPEDCRLLLIGSNMAEFSSYNAIPHLLAPVVSEPARGVAALQWTAGEVAERYKRMALLGLQDVGLYNNRIRDAKRRGETLTRTVQTGFDPRSGQPLFDESPLVMEVMPTIVVLVEELADLMVANRRDTEQAVRQLAANARAAGIHLIMATQRPAPDVITPELAAALPARMTFRLNNKADSRLILGEAGAEQLLGHGDMLLMVELPGSRHMTRLRVHGALVSPEEVESVAASARAQGAPRYVEGLGDPFATFPATAGADQPAPGRVG